MGDDDPVDTTDLPDWLSDEECVDESDVEIEITSEEEDDHRLPLVDDEEEEVEEEELFGSLDDVRKIKLRGFKRKAPCLERTYSGDSLQLEPDDHIL